MKIGFIGIGKMGTPIVNHVAKLNAQVIAWDINASTKEKIDLSRIRFADDVGEMADCDIILTALPGADENQQVFYENDILHDGIIWISLSTIRPSFIKTFDQFAQARNAFFYAIPIMGRSDAAESGTLHTLFSGPKTQYEIIEPILQTFSQKIHDFGEDKINAMIAKLAGNFLFNVTIESLGEAFALTDKHQIDRQKFLALILSDEMYNCAAFHLYTDLIQEKKFLPAGFELHHGLKDVSAILDAGALQNVPMPMASLIRDHFLEALSFDLRHLDESALSLIPMHNSGQLALPF